MQEEVRRDERLREEAGQELVRTRARVDDEIQRVAHEAAEQIDARNRRLDVAASFARQLQEELRESREEAASRQAKLPHAEYQAEHQMMLMDRAIYDNAVG